VTQKQVAVNLNPTADRREFRADINREEENVKATEDFRCRSA
jgi:hypothetical protein